MSATETDVPTNETAKTAVAAPKRITNAQTVCNEKNEKGKLCNGHLKQLRTAGEPAEVHLRGDDVLSKCQTCGTFYMGPPLGHVRDPNKQWRFVEAELSALLQAAGGTLPIIKKDERGVFVMVESTTEHAPAHAKAQPVKPAAATPVTATSAIPTPTAPPAAPPVAQPPKTVASAVSHKAGADPNRALFNRSTYMGVKDTGPVAGETFEQKVARLKAVSAAAKQRADEGGGEPSPAAATPAPQAALIEQSAPPAAATESVAPADQPTQPTVAVSSQPHKPTGQADRTLMRRSTYCGVVDTGPVAGETFAQKCERLAKIAAAAKQRSEEAGG